MVSGSDSAFLRQTGVMGIAVVEIWVGRPIEAAATICEPNMRGGKALKKLWAFFFAIAILLVAQGVECHNKWI